MRNKYLAISVLSIISLFLASVVFILNSRLEELVEATKKQIQVEIAPIKRVAPTVEQKSNFSFRKVSDDVTQSVVYVEATVEVRGKMPKDKNHQQYWDQYDGVARSTSVGSGVVISDNGYILTNNHVIESALDNKVLIVLNDNRSYEGDIIGTDPSTDLAVVKVSSNDLKGIVIGDSDDVFVGDWVLAIGNPFRLRSTVTAGIVSALSRDVSIIEDRMRIENFIQTDAAINRGNSGGALINEYGELIGINTAIATETGTYEGYGFAIPINMGIKIARDIIEFGEVQRAYLGVQIVSVTQRRAKQLGLEMVSGVEIVNAVETGAAYLAGIRQGDVVLAINNKPVRAHNELQAKIAEHRPGEIIDVDVFTNGERVVKQVTLQGAEKKEIKEWLGLAEAPLDEVILQEDSLNTMEEDLSVSSIERFSKELKIRVVTLEDETKLFIQELSPKSAYFMSGLQEGDQLLEINDKPLRSYTDFKIHLQHYRSRKQNVIFKIKREGNKIGYFSLIP
ncbi:PDZ domain-containing protein [bacterium]|nr:MAG: PDZ domain-containing protein [bacterium]